MLVLVLCFLAGILSVQALSAMPAWGWLAVMPAVIGIVAWRRYWPLAVFLLGISWALIFAEMRLQQRLPERLAGQDIELTGFVTDLPEVEARQLRFNFKVYPVIKDVPELLRLSWYQPDQEMKSGQMWRFTARLKPPHGSLNPGGFDYERWLLVEGIGATGYVRQQKLLAPAGPLSMQFWRQRIVDRIDRLDLAPNQLAMIKALTIGDGSSLSDGQWDVFRKTGTTHLLVISGSHVALIAALVYLLVLKCWSRIALFSWSPPKAAALSAILGAIFYAALTGFAVPAQRAVLMLSVGMIAVMLQRHISPSHALAMALLAVLLFDPLVVLLPGFWLSFVAVSLIIYAIAGRLSKPGLFKATIKINVYTSIGLAPLLLYFFQQVSVISPLANLLAVPLIGFIIVPLALLAVLVLLISPSLAQPLFNLAGVMLDVLWRMLRYLADLPISIFTQIQPDWLAVSLAIPGVLLLLAPKGMPARGLGLILLLPLVITRLAIIPEQTAKLTLLDVGQGLAAVVQTAHHTLVFDTGAKYSANSDAGKSVVIPYLRSQGVTNVHALVVSHGDNDHIGGAASLLAEYNAERILTSVPDRLAEYQPISCESGQSWKWDGVQFAMLSPKSGRFLSENDNSCVLQLGVGQHNILLTGDIEAEAETLLVKEYAGQLRSTILVAPHHGSNTSSTLDFLRKVRPALILIPAGYRNQFGHPHPEVLRRYAGLNLKWLLNAEEGAIDVQLDKSITVASWRRTHGHYWNFHPPLDHAAEDE